MFRLRTIFGFGSRMVFDGDDNDANNTNADGGKTGDDNKASGGGDDGKRGDSSATKPETHTIKVDGVEKILSDEEYEKYAQLGFSSTQRYQDAKEKEKTAERGLRIETLTKSISRTDDPSEADVLELADLLEIDPKEFTASLKEDPPQKATTGADFSAKFQTEFQRLFNASPAEVKAGWDFSTQRHVKDARKEIRDISDKAVDKDEIIGKMIIGEDKEEILTEVKNMVAEDVLRKIQDGKTFGAELVTATVQMVRSKLTKLGIPKKLNQHPIVLGLTPSEGLSSIIQADEPIKRVPSDEDAGEKNLIERYLQRAVHAAQKMK